MSEPALREAIIATARRMNALRINQGKSGNVSARATRATDAAGPVATDGATCAPAPAPATEGFLITPSGLPYEDITSVDVSWMPLVAEDERAAAGPRLPSSEWHARSGPRAGG